MPLILAVLLLATGAALSSADELLVCGWDEVYILRVAPGAEPRKIFSWQAQERPELPAAYRTRFRTTDECKAVAGNRILITASSDGVALVERATGRTTFWGQCANAHSADLLPGERIAVACSVRDPGGNRLALFDARTPEKELFSTELHSGHGAVWDARRNTLWALSDLDLRAYTPRNWESARPTLELAARYPLPSGGGHELSPDGDSLIVSATRDVWLFDRNTRKFAPHPQLAGSSNVKSASVHPRTRRLAFTLADHPDWWTATIRFRNPDGAIVRAGERLYKVRWIGEGPAVNGGR